MTGIVATRRAMKELVDGTIRVQIDIDPAFRGAFLQAFPDIDMPVALAPLKPDFAQITHAEPDKPKARQTPSQWLAMRCQESEFWAFLGSTIAVPMPSSEAQAIDAVRAILGVTSRAEIDTDPAALERFHSRLREPWIEWQAQEGQW